jgi:hypothetical protein
MNDREAKRPGSHTAETVLPPVAGTTHSVPRSKLLPLGAFAALLMAAASLILFMPSGAETGAVKCYDSAGNAEPCGAQAGVSPSRFDSLTVAVHRPASWITTALYRPSWNTAAVDQPDNSPATAPAARRSGKKHVALACHGRLMRCFFSAVRNGFTHLASAAGTMEPTRAARAHL